MKRLGTGQLRSLWLKLSVLVALATASGSAFAVCDIAFVDPVTQQSAYVTDVYAWDCSRPVVYNTLFDDLLADIPDCRHPYRCRFYILDPETGNKWEYQGLFNQ